MYIFRQILSDMRKLFVFTAFLAITASVYGLNPVRTYAVKPSDFGMNYTEIRIKTEDNLELNAWMFKASQTSYKIMVLSDDGNGNMADLMEHVSMFLSLGYHVITYDYRGYGTSSDFEIKPAFYFYAQFEKDLNAVIDYLKKDHANIPKIHLFGIGIGGGLSIAVAANRNLGTVVADSPYTTLELAKTRMKEAKGLDVLLPLGFNKVSLEPKYALESKGGQLSGVLLIVGENDPVYTVKDIKELAKVRASITTVFVVKKSNGDNNLSVDKDNYLAQLKDFLGK
jgi:dienelactone hydrolase